MKLIRRGYHSADRSTKRQLKKKVQQLSVSDSNSRLYMMQPLVRLN